MESKKDSDIDALLFKPSKVSWGVQKAVINLEPRLERLVLFSILAAVLSGILWAHFSKRAIVVDSTGELVPRASPIPMVAKTNFTIRKLNVSNNQLLKKGDVVLETTRFLGKRDVNQFTQAFSVLRELLGKEIKGECEQSCMSRLNQKVDDSIWSLANIDQDSEFSTDLQQLNKSLKDYYLQLKIAKSLPTTLTSLRNEIRITKKRLSEIKKRRAQKILAVEYEDLQTKQINLETQVREREQNTRSQLESSRTDYQINLSKIPLSFDNYLDNTVVRAPTTGKIRFERVKGEGQVVNAGESLFVMTQASSDLWLRFKILEADLNKVKQSQEVRIDLASYPASEFGIQKAVVVEVVEKLPVENDQQRNSHFTGYANLDSQIITFKDKTYPLRSGMQGRVKIIVKHESVLSIFIKKLFSIKEEYFGDFQ